MPQRGSLRGGHALCTAAGAAAGSLLRFGLDGCYSGPRNDFVVSFIATALACLAFGVLAALTANDSGTRWFSIGFCSGLGALSVAVVSAATSPDVWLSVAYLVATVVVAAGALITGQAIGRLGKR